MQRCERILFLGIPLLLLAAWIYPHLPHFSNGLCIFRNITGINCPGCGLSRSLAALVHGDLKESILLNPMGVIAFVIGIYFWFKIVILKVVLKGRSGFLGSPAILNMLAIIFVAGLFVQWFVYLCINVFFPFFRGA